MLNVIDIINKQLPSNMKKINHFMEYEGIVYVSCDFGIVQFDSRRCFWDTYFIGDNGAEISIRQTAVYNGFIYAATINGEERAVSNENLNDLINGNKLQQGLGHIETLVGTSGDNMEGNIQYNTNTNSFTSFLDLGQSTST
jgi:hypothetical protein